MTDAVTDFIAQRLPIVMIDRITYADNDKAITTLDITSDTLFTEKGIFREPGLIENIAQTAAAQVGYMCKQQNIPVPIGYIAAIRNLSILKLPVVGNRITTTITRKNQILDIMLIDGVIQLDDEIIGSCEMRVFIKSNTHEDHI